MEAKIYTPLQLSAKLKKLDLFQEIHDVLEKETWLIHYTDHPEKIIQEGFRFGETLIHRLAMTWEDHKPKTHPTPGYNFAFEAEDPTGAGAPWDAEIWPIGSIAQDKAILFQAPGLSTMHYDGFPQVIFRGKDANFKNAKILEFFELEDEGRAVKIFSPQAELLDNGLSEDHLEETITKWCQTTKNP